MTIALLGAGHIGQMIARWLDTVGDHEATVFECPRQVIATAAAVALSRK